ncbi:unnamed protein product [Protopolystoma xenopodis]|uniref:SUN domain-containing protein n=1 Tax=Protopolystoma xenopodis TaxID=117903 RepID=A0A3S4ZV78_9PLAT|nr:unnamed protein product [Protopolystoma xenopodis]
MLVVLSCYRIRRFSSQDIFCSRDEQLPEEGFIKKSYSMEGNEETFAPPFVSKDNHIELDTSAKLSAINVEAAANQIDAILTFNEYRASVISLASQQKRKLVGSWCGKIGWMISISILFGSSGSFSEIFITFTKMSLIAFLSLRSAKHIPSFRIAVVLRFIYVLVLTEDQATGPAFVLKQDGAPHIFQSNEPIRLSSHDSEATFHRNGIRLQRSGVGQLVNGQESGSSEPLMEYNAEITGQGDNTVRQIDRLGHHKLEGISPPDLATNLRSASPQVFSDTASEPTVPLDVEHSSIPMSHSNGQIPSGNSDHLITPHPASLHGTFPASDRVSPSLLPSDRPTGFIADALGDASKTVDFGTPPHSGVLVSGGPVVGDLSSSPSDSSATAGLVPPSQEDIILNSAISSSTGSLASDGHSADSTQVESRPSIQVTVKRNVAAIECGAKLLAASPKTKNPEAVLNSNQDEYLNIPCIANKWFVIETCEPVQLRTIHIANYELFSSRAKVLKVFTSDRSVYP